MYDYSGISSSPFRIGVQPVAPPFAPEAFMRPAPVPGPVRIPAGLPGPIFGAPGWHVGPPVHVSGYGYGEAEEKKVKISPGAIAGIVLGGLALLALPAALAWAMSRKKTRANPKRRRNGRRK